MSVIKRAMVLAAGRGERMRPLTDKTPKPLLRVGSQTLIERHLVKLARAGIHEVAVNVSWLGSVLQAALGNGSRYEVRIHWFVEGPVPLDTAGGIVNALKFFADEPFVVVNADVYTDHSLQLAEPAAGRLASLVLVPNPPQHPRGDFGLECDELRIGASSRYTIAGIACYHPKFFAGLASGKRPLKPLLDLAAGAGLVSAAVYAGVWEDVGTPERLAALDAKVRKI